MIRFTVEAAKSNFFDRKSVLAAVDRANVRNLSKWGAFTRQNARKLLQYDDRPSAPGKPPHVHRTMRRKRVNKRTGKVTFQGVSPLREFVFFAYDPSTKSVVAGPAKLNAKLGDAPAALEYGGASVVRRGRGRTSTVKIRPRPFMHPAAARSNKELPDIYRNSIQRV